MLRSFLMLAAFFGFTVGQFKGFAVQLNAHATGRHRF